MIAKLEKVLSTDSKETGNPGFDGAHISIPQHAKIHFAIRELQLKLNEVIDVLNELEIPDEP